MSDRDRDRNRKIKEFPDLSTKLNAPGKKSLFERQRAEAEAKRQREEAETAAVYKDFLASFDDDDSGPAPPSRSSGSLNPPHGPRGNGPSGAGGPARRHFGAPSGPRASGPGSLGPPPPSRKRAHDGSFSQQNERGVLGFESSGPVDAATAFATSDDEEEDRGRDKAAERAAPKPTLHLSSLPPGFSPGAVRALMPPGLKVDEVKMLPTQSTQPGGMEARRTASAIVTLTKETPASEIDSTVNALQNRYLGWGCYLNLSRHLSSAALGGALASGAGLGSGKDTLPFGAKPVFTGPTSGLSRAPPPPGQRGTFAPPPSYGGPGSYNRQQPSTLVHIQPPSDIKQLKLIHKTLEMLLRHGPEFEALLMSRPEIQREEKWAWLWDARSVGGVWYRWRLWEISTGAKRAAPARSQFAPVGARGAQQAEEVFDKGAPWQLPEKALRFEFTTGLHEIVSESDYNSSEDDESGDEGQKRQNDGGPIDGGLGSEKAYLNPLGRAKLTHLLSRLPDSTGKLRKGDVARVAAFAISHAGAGADEVVDMIVSNIVRPFALSAANPLRTKANDGDDDDALPASNPEDDADKRAPTAKEDPSSAKLIGLYIISDILSSSSTSGVRGAWRYRQTFEGSLRDRKIFEGLGRLEKDLNWGRLRAEKWKRSVNNLLSLWESWCVFPQSSQEHFAEVFNNPPLSEEERREAERKEEEKAKKVAKSKWKSVQPGAQQEPAAESKSAPEVTREIPVPDDVDGEPMMDDDLDGEPMDEDLDGVPMEDDDLDGEPMDEDESERPKEPSSGKAVQPADQSDPEGEDMFAD